MFRPLLSVVLFCSSLHAAEVCGLIDTDSAERLPEGQVIVTYKTCAVCTEKSSNWCAESTQDSASPEDHAILRLKNRNAVYKRFFEQGFELKTPDLLSK